MYNYINCIWQYSDISSCWNNWSCRRRGLMQACVTCQIVNVLSEMTSPLDAKYRLLPSEIYLQVQTIRKELQQRKHTSICAKLNGVL
jgi:hypothetical protein